MLDELREKVIGFCDKGNLSEAYKLLLPDVENNDGEALALMGDLYYYGSENDFPANFQKAFEYYTTSAIVGNHYGSYMLACCYANGEGIEQSDIKAFENYKIAAELGNIAAKIELGLCYINGIGTTANEEEGLNWMHSAADDGHAQAQFNLGVLYRDKQIAESALHWFRTAMNNGHIEAAVDLANCLMFDDVCGIQATEDNLREAFEVLNMAVKENECRAGYMLSLFYRTGTLVKESLNTAYELVRKSADLGFEMAKEELTHYKSGLFGYKYVQ